MKRYLSLIVCVLLLVTMLAGCSSEEAKVTLGTYEGIEVTVGEVTVTEEEIDTAVRDDVAVSIEATPIEGRPVQSGDIANIDYEGKVDGVAFDGGTAARFDLEIGSGSFIEGFEDQIIGMEIGATSDITVTFPEEYPNSPDLAGVEAVFTVTVNSISGKDIPDEITDEMIAEISEYTTVSEYREYIRSMLEEEAAATNEESRKNTVWEAVLATSTVDRTAAAKQEYYASLYDKYYQSYADYYGVELEEFLQTYAGMTMETYESQRTLYAKESAEKCAIVDAIAAEQGITVSDEEYQAAIEADAVGEEDEAMYGESIRDSLLMEKVLDFVVGSANITVVEK